MERQPQFPQVDVLRAFAAYSVIMLHVVAIGPWPEFPTTGPLSWFRWGDRGVDLFFVISGFVIFLSAESLWRRSDAYAARFMIRRLGRILPLHWLTVFVALFTANPEMLDYPYLLGNVLAHLAFVHTFDKSWFSSINGINWTIAIEMQFYLLVAIAAPVLFRAKPAVILLVLVPIAWLWRWHALQATAPGDLYDYRLFMLMTQLPGTLDQFGIGMALAVFVRASGFQRLAEKPWAAWALSLLSATLVVLFVFPQAIDGIGVAISPIFRKTFIGLAFGAVVLTACLLSTARAVALTAPLRYLGTISYGLYLWHLIVLMTLIRLGLTGAVLCAAVLALTTMIAAASWHFFERPLLLRAKALEANWRRPAASAPRTADRAG